MAEAAFSLRQDEEVLKQSSHNHFLRPEVSCAGRLCRAYLTNQRLVLCEAYYDVARKTEKGAGAILYEAPLASIVQALSCPDTIEPALELQMRAAPAGRDMVVLCFRDQGWHAGLPQRLGECRDWVVAIEALRHEPGSPPGLPPQTSPPRPSGRLLQGKFEIVRQIGSGGMGLVFEGRDHSLDRPVAIKKMRPEIRMSGRLKARFLQEAKTSAALHHPFIVDIYAIVDEGDEIYLVFEYVDGESLAEFLDRKGRITLARMRPLLKCTCEALAFAHASKVAHRDLKPSNIMLTKQGYAKVMDFGVARQIKDTVSRLTHKDVSGTLPYMAPEQERGRFDARSDIYSLGATVYELLTGQLPFPGPDFYQQKEREDFQRLATAAPQAPAELAAAVERSLRFDPEARFETVAAFAAALGVA
jgi:hypothetical protein